MRTGGGLRSGQGVCFQFQSKPILLLPQIKTLRMPRADVGDSLQAFRKHEIVDVFEDPGNCDLTANVDFAYLRESLTGTGEFRFSQICWSRTNPKNPTFTATPLGPISQAQFLISLGLQPRLRKLLDTAPPERREAIEKGAKRLIDVLGMGSQYQVMGVVSGEPEMKEGIYPFPVKKETVESKVLRP